MKIELSIEKSEELRSYIKKQIEEQVKSIVREDFSEMVEKEIYQKLDSLTKSMTNGQWSLRLQTSCDNYVSKKMHEKNIFSYGGFSEDVNQRLIQILTERLDDKKFNTLVDKAANQKIKDLLK